MGRNPRNISWTLLVWAFGTVHVGHSQTLYGSLVGNVRDPPQAVVAGAVVRLTNTDTQQSREAVTNDVGGYYFATVPPGTYDLTVRKEGFTPSPQKGIAVTANNTARLDVTLTVGSVTESVTVGGMCCIYGFQGFPGFGQNAGRPVNRPLQQNH